MTRPMSMAFAFGRFHAALGWPLEHCPYPHGTAAYDWLNGHEDFTLSGRVEPVVEADVALAMLARGIGG